MILLPAIILFKFMVLRRRKEIAARPPPYNSGPLPKVHSDIPSVPTSLTPNFSVMDDTQLMPHPDPIYGYPTTSSPMKPYGNLQGSASDSHPPMYTLDAQSVPYNHPSHPHRHPISSPAVSVNSATGDITDSTITNVGNNNSHGNSQESPSDSWHPPMYTLDTQSVPYYHAYHPHRHPISSPTVSVNSGGHITNTAISNVGDNNSCGNLQGNASNTHLHPRMYTPNTQSVYHHNACDPTSGYPFSGPSVSVNSGLGNVTNTTISNVGNNNSSNTYCK